MTKQDCLRKFQAEIDLAQEHLSHAVIWGYSKTPDEIEQMARLLAARDMALATLNPDADMVKIIERWIPKERYDA